MSAPGNTIIMRTFRISPTSTGAIPMCDAAMMEALRFWLDRGVDGFRLDTRSITFFEDEHGVIGTIRRTRISARARRRRWRSIAFISSISPEVHEVLREFGA